MPRFIQFVYDKAVIKKDPALVVTDMHFWDNPCETVPAQGLKQYSQSTPDPGSSPDSTNFEFHQFSVTIISAEQKRAILYQRHDVYVYV
ncbi:hypothetical protein A6R68_11469, partial [Neotoma lepida]